MVRRPGTLLSPTARRLCMIHFQDRKQPDMYRLIISYLLEGAIAGAGLFLFRWIGRFSSSWQLLLGFIAAFMLLNFIRLIPVLRMESQFQRVLREAGNDREKVDTLFGVKRRPLVSSSVLVLFGLLCLCGLIARVLGCSIASQPHNDSFSLPPSRRFVIYSKF